MAEINTNDDGKKKGQPKKLHLRVDFTPMVDMNMLLITFFMFCTTLSKPQVMNLVMPTKETYVNSENRTKADESKTVTILLGPNNIAYYYFGKPNYGDYTSLIATNYDPDGLRAMLVKRNAKVVQQIADLRKQKNAKEITEEIFKEKVKEVRDAKGGQVVVIKPTDAATYKNLVDVLDELQICSIGLYAIVDITEGDKFLIDNYMQKGALTSQAKSKGLAKL